MQTKTTTRKRRSQTTAEEAIAASVVIAAAENEISPDAPRAESSELISDDWGRNVAYARYHSAYTPH